MSYFYGKTAAALYAKSRECNYANIIENNGSVVENKDGTVSVYTNTGSPFALDKYCCEVIKAGYTFNIDTQKCMWSTNTPTIASQSIQTTTTPCTLDSFKLTLNPNGNNGSLFYVGDSSEKCSLNIEFDYLIKISCESLTSILNGGTVGKPMISTVQTTQLVSNAQTIECEALAKQIAKLKETIAATNYSITCTQDIPYIYTPPTQAALTPFTRTGFGLYEFDLSDYITETLCLTNAGLTEWSKILGSRYNSFLAGDPNSYNCNDFNILKEKNDANLNNNRPELAFTCTTPFGTKTKLVNDLNKLKAQYDSCIKESSVTTTQLNQQQTVVTTSEGICGTPIDTIENLDISVTLDYVDSNQALVTVATYPLLASIGTGNLYTYLSENEESGFLVCGEPNSSEIANGITGCTPLYLGSTDNVFSCSGLITNILDGLLIESKLDKATFDATFNKKALGSKWLHYNAVVSDESVLTQIANKNIKITIKVNSSCGDFCILLDNIQLNKVCTLVSENNMFISSSPGFELNRVIDNKKSWVANTTPENRPFSITNVSSTNGIRQTNYNVNDERLVINTKEIDLDISIASAIETDVWCYISDNPCLLTATTTNNCGCTILPCFKDSFNIIELKDLTYSGWYFEDVLGIIRANRDSWLKNYNERNLAYGPYYTIKDSPYSPIINDYLTTIYNATKVAYSKSNYELSKVNVGYILGFTDKPNYYQIENEPISQVVKTECGDVFTIGGGDLRLYFVANKENGLELYIQDTTNTLADVNTLINYTSLLNEGNVDSVYVNEFSGTPQLYCTVFSNLINTYSAYKKSNINFDVNSNVDVVNNGVMNNNDIFYARWDSTKNKCIARNPKAIPEAFSLNYLKQDYVKFCNRYDEGNFNDCIANAIGDITNYNSSVLLSTFTGDTTYDGLGNSTITNILDTSSISVGSYVFGDGVTYNSQVISKTSDSITLSYINTITATGVTLENWSARLEKVGDIKSQYNRGFRDAILRLNNEINLSTQRHYSTSVTDLNGNIPDEPVTGMTVPYYAFIPVNVTTTIRKGSITGDIVYQESYKLNDPSSTSDAGLPTNYNTNRAHGLAFLNVPIGIAYTNGFQYNSSPLSTDYSTYDADIPFGTYITGSTAGLPFFDSGNNTSDAIDYANEYYVHLDIVDYSGNTYHATNNDFNLKDANGLIKFPTTASTQTLDINSLISSIDNKKQELLEARDIALNVIVKNGGCINC